MSIKAVANTSVLSDTHVQVAASRYQYILNSNTTTVANVEIGVDNSTVFATLLVLPSSGVVIDCGSTSNYISLNTDVATVYRTPVAGGSDK